MFLWTVPPSEKKELKENGARGIVWRGNSVMQRASIAEADRKDFEFINISINQAQGGVPIINQCLIFFECVRNAHG